MLKCFVTPFSQLGLKEGSADLPSEPATLTFTILKNTLLVNSKPMVESETLDFFSMWKNGMLLTFGGVPGKVSKNFCDKLLLHQQHPHWSLLNALFAR